MDLVKSIQSTLYERIVSPLAGIFVMSWAVMHYELIMMILSNIDMQSKAQYVYELMIVDAKNNWSGSEWVDWAPLYFGILHPLMYSFAALSVYSILSVPAYGITMTGKYCLQRIRRFFDLRAPVSAKVYQELQDLFEDQSSKYRDKVIKNDAEIGNYKKVIQEEKAENIKLIDEIEALKEKAGEFERNINIKTDHESHMVAKAEYENDQSAQGDVFIESSDEKFEQIKADRINALSGGLDTEEIADDGELKRNGNDEYLTGTYKELFFDSPKSELSRMVMQYATVNRNFMVDGLLRTMGKPKTEENIKQIIEILQLFDLYHLVETVDDREYFFSELGKQFKIEYMDGEKALRGFCEAIDDAKRI